MRENIDLNGNQSLVEKDNGSVSITVPDKYSEDRLRHWLNSILTRSALSGLVMYILITVYFRDTPLLFCLIPTVILLTRGIPGWIMARQAPWSYVLDDYGVRIQLRKKGAIRVNPGDVPVEVIWNRHNIAEVDRATERGLPCLRLLTRMPNGSLKHRMTLVYDTEDALAINRDVLPLIERYRSSQDLT